MTQIASKNHFYPFSLKMAAQVNAAWCQDKAFLYLVPPQDALTIENLFCHFRFTFDAGVAAPDRVVQYIGICNEIPLSPATEPNYLRKIDLNQAADGSRKVNIKLDLTSLLNKGNVNYREYFETPVSTDYTYVIIKLADANRGVLTVGTVDLWKVDGLFTSKGIR